MEEKIQKDQFGFRCKALILELLAAVCLVELGHDVVLAAFDNYRIVSNSFFFHRINNQKFLIQKECQEKHRFETLMKSFTQPSEFNVDYMVSFSSFDFFQQIWF